MNIGYFSQNLDVLDNNKTVLENVLKDSIQDEVTVRNILANLYIKGNDVFKNISNLSGGERVKVAITKLLVGDYNLLILDEPTNFLDIYSIEALEKLIKLYKGTILLISHDINLIDNVCNYLFIIDNKKLIEFNGNYTEYKEFKDSQMERKAKLAYDNDLLLDVKISEIISKLSYTNDEVKRKELEEEYQELIEIKRKVRRN